MIDPCFDANGGALVEGVRRAYAQADRDRMTELDRLIRSGHANTDPRHIPLELLEPAAVPHVRTEKRAVPKLVHREIVAVQPFPAEVDEIQERPTEVVHHQEEKKAMAQKCDKGCGRTVRASVISGTINPTCKRCRMSAGDWHPPSRPARKTSLESASVQSALDRRVVGEQLYGYTVPELLDLRRKVDTEIRDRLTRLEAERTALLEAVASDAAALRGHTA
jgi:hypothetical protein